MGCRILSVNNYYNYYRTSRNLSLRNKSYMYEEDSIRNLYKFSSSIHIVTKMLSKR